MTQREVSTQHIVLTTQDVTVDGEFPTIVLHLTDVLHLAAITGNAGDRRLIKQVAGGVPIELRRDGDTSAEQRDISCQVTGDGGLPLDVLVRIVAGSAVVQFTISSGGRSKLRTTRVVRSIEEAPQVVADVVVTSQTECSTNLQLINPLHILQELLLVYYPSTRN